MPREYRRMTAFGQEETNERLLQSRHSRSLRPASRYVFITAFPWRIPTPFRSCPCRVHLVNAVDGVKSRAHR
jgi:hypothetical protein